MCPIWPFHMIIIYLLPLLITYTAAKQWKSIEFSNTSLKRIHMGTSKSINFTIYNLTEYDYDFGQVYIEVTDPNVLMTSFKENHNDVIDLKNYKTILYDGNIVSQFKSKFDVQAQFLGYSDIRFKLKHNDGLDDSNPLISDPIKVTVIRAERIIDKIFTISVASLVSIIFVNFGCVLDWPLVKKSLKRPVGPIIGFISQFLFMPVISFILARLLFPDSIPLQLGLFFAGVAPGGGASNVWIYSLGGNINLSITMTAVSTFAAFVMIPLWSFTLGRIIFHDGNMVIPYRNITSFAVALVIPLTIGYVIQKKLPKISQIMVRFLKPFSGSLIAFIVIFAVYTNMYLFKLFTWKIVIAGAGLPWFGYLLGYLFARMMRQLPADTLAICVETGIQNTGIAIFMLRFSLEQPEADMTTVVPVAVALMTPVPLILYYFYYKYKSRIDPSELKTKPHEIIRLPIDNIDINTISEHIVRQNGVLIKQNGVNIKENGGFNNNNGSINNDYIKNGVGGVL